MYVVFLIVKKCNSMDGTAVCLEQEQKEYSIEEVLEMEMQGLRPKAYTGHTKSSTVYEAMLGRPKPGNVLF